MPSRPWNQEPRIMLTMEYVTNPKMGTFKWFISNMKDAIAYFGFSTLGRGRPSARRARATHTMKYQFRAAIAYSRTGLVPQPPSACTKTRQPGEMPAATHCSKVAMSATSPMSHAVGR
jgi:hypothetical protein